MNRPVLKRLLFFILTAEFSGVISAVITGPDNFREFFRIYEKPPLLPPAWFFLIVLTVFYALNGISAALISAADTKTGSQKDALLLYISQLAFSFSWSIIFFRAQKTVTAAAVIIILIILVTMMTAESSKINSKAARLNIPYMIWLCFAAYLNTAVIAVN